MSSQTSFVAVHKNSESSDAPIQQRKVATVVKGYIAPIPSPPVFATRSLLMKKDVVSPRMKSTSTRAPESRRSRSSSNNKGEKEMMSDRMEGAADGTLGISEDDISKFRGLMSEEPIVNDKQLALKDDNDQRILNEREEAIDKIASDVIQINDLMKDLNTMVIEQDAIENNVVQEKKEKNKKKNTESIVATSKSQTVSGPSGSKDMNSIVVLQNFDGSWNLDSNLAQVFGVTLDQLKQTLKELNLSQEKEKIWATALSLLFLTLAFKHLKEDWEILSEKTKEYLNQKLGSEMKSILDKAKSTLIQLKIV